MDSTRNQHQHQHQQEAKQPDPAEQSARLQALAARATKYLNSQGYQVEQQNGQRISQLITSDQPEQVAPKRTREVFVGKLPRDMFEDELLPAMQRAGRVYRIRLMMDFSGTNRGFGFVEYMKHSEAVRACRMLDKQVLRAGSDESGVILSFDNKRLFFGKLPPEITASRLLTDLRKILIDVEDVQMPEGPVPEPSSNSSRFAFVTFKSHRAATQARRLLLPGGPTIMYDREITIDWAKPDPPPPVTKSSSPTGRKPSAASRAQPTLINLDLNNNQESIPNKNHQQPAAHRPARASAYLRRGSSRASASANKGSSLINKQAGKLEPPLRQQMTNKFVNLNRSFLSPIKHLGHSGSPIFANQQSNQNIINGLQDLSLGSNDPSQQQQQLQSPHFQILGPRTQMMLSDQFPMSQTDYGFNSLSIYNINLAEISLDKLKRIFELDHRFQVSAIRVTGPSSITVTYSKPEQAQSMLETLTIMPHSFYRLALPGQLLQPVKEYGSALML